MLNDESLIFENLQHLASSFQTAHALFAEAPSPAALARVTEIAAHYRQAAEALLAAQTAPGAALA